MNKNIIKEAISNNLIKKDFILNNVLNKGDKSIVIFLHDRQNNSCSEKTPAKEKHNIFYTLITCTVFIALIGLTIYAVFIDSYNPFSVNTTGHVSDTTNNGSNTPSRRTESPSRAIVTPSRMTETPNHVVDSTDSVKGNFSIRDSERNIILSKEYFNYVSFLSESKDQYSMLIKMKESGAEIFREFCRNNINKDIFIYLDKYLLFNTNISKEIPGDTVKISGLSHSKEDMQLLCDKINNGDNSIKQEITEYLKQNILAGQNFSELNFTLYKCCTSSTLLPGKNVSISLYVIEIDKVLTGNSILVINDGKDNIYKITYDISVAADFYIEDIDSDQTDEIIMQHNTGGNGGYGINVTKIFKYNNNEFSEISFKEDTSKYYVSLADGSEIFVKNDYHNINIPLMDMLNSEYYFNGNGNLTEEGRGVNENGTIDIDPFYLINPIDIDNDNIYEINTAQYCSYGGHGCMIGVLYKIWEYDPLNNCMKIIKTHFKSVYEEDTYNFSSDNDYIYDKMEEYFNMWYN